MSDHVVCRFSDLAPCTAKRVEVGRLGIAVVRIDDDVYAIADRCTHADISLAEGEVLCEEREIECWKHGSTFSLIDGEPQSLPATKAEPVFPVRVEGDDVIVTVGGDS